MVKDTIRERDFSLTKKRTEMVQEKINLILKKIQTILGPNGEISTLEQDLIKGYLRELYEMVDQLGSQPEEEKVEQAEPVMKNPMAEVSKRVEDQPKKQEQSFAFVDTPELSAETEEIESLEPIVEHAPSEDELTTKPQTNGIKQAPVEEDFKSEALAEVITAKAPINKDFRELFAVENAKDLSEKLSRSPLHDLHKAFSINDRLLVTKRLFGGSTEEFLDTLDILNSKHSFEDAKVYLERYVIEKFHWLDEARKDQARDFITLVSRRYTD